MKLNEPFTPNSVRVAKLGSEGSPSGISAKETNKSTNKSGSSQMRYTSTILVAGIIGLAAPLNFAPAHAAPAAISPAVADRAEPGASIQQVHRRRGHAHYCWHYPWKHSCYKYARYKKRHYHKPYYSYHPHYYRRPGVTFSFSFGGGHHGHHGW
jgi:hypothetical protein